MKNTLALMQIDVRRRYKGYKKGLQQGLPMIWDNMMKELQARYEAPK